MQRHDDGNSSTARAVGTRADTRPTIALLATLPIALLLWLMIILVVWEILKWAAPA